MYAQTRVIRLLYAVDLQHFGLNGTYLSDDYCNNWPLPPTPSRLCMVSWAIVYQIPIAHPMD